ncbi:MAG: metallophosphoesterase family protein [Clostridia bacterium]|nr:metallophosphoesterase family protein [Clostridia bacterium]
MDYYLHLGDGARDFDALQSFILLPYPRALLFGVKGNCDWTGEMFPEELQLHIGAANVMMTHGHRYGVKQGYDVIDTASARAGCTVTLFGHTHRPLVEQRSTLLINPGSARDDRLALLTVHDDGRAEGEIL